MSDWRRRARLGGEARAWLRRTSTPTSCGGGGRCQGICGGGNDGSLAMEHRLIACAATGVDLPVTTDVHTPSDAEHAAQCVDLLQIPAFRCRQT